MAPRASVLVAVALAAGVAAPEAHAAKSPAIKPAQQVATLMSSHKVVWDLGERGARGIRIGASRTSPACRQPSP